MLDEIVLRRFVNKIYTFNAFDCENRVYDKRS